MFKGLTPRAHKVLTLLAQEEAKRFHSGQLLPEHVVLALLKGWRRSGRKGAAAPASRRALKMLETLRGGGGQHGALAASVPYQKSVRSKS